MKIAEEKRDLVSVNDYVKIPYAVAFYTSADLVMDELGKELNKRWRIRSKILELYGMQVRDFNEGVVLAVPIKENNREFVVYALVIKQFNFHKSSYHILRSVLEQLKTDILSKQLSKLSIPTVQGTTATMEWNKIKPIIKEIFQDTNVNIKVCNSACGK